MHAGPPCDPLATNEAMRLPTMLLGPQSEELELVLGIELVHHAARLDREVGYQRRVLNRDVVVKGGPDRDTIPIDHNDALDTLVGLKPFESLVHNGAV